MKKYTIIDLTKEQNIKFYNNYLYAKFCLDKNIIIK